MISINDSFIKRIWEAHAKSRCEIQARYNYYNGEHNFLTTPTIRQRSKSNVPVNFLDYLIDSHVALSTGLPYEYIPDNPADPAITNLEPIVKHNNLTAIDSQHFLNSMIAGYSVELHSFDEHGIKITCYDPREFAFIFEHDNETIHLAIHRAELQINSVFDGRLIESEESLFTVYTGTEIHTYHQNKKGLHLINQEPHYYGQVPIVLFAISEKRTPFLNSNLMAQNDLFNRVNNSRVDELEYKNAILAAIGFATTAENLEVIANIQQQGMMILPKDADLKWIVSTNEAEKYTNALKDSREAIYLQGDVPDRQDIQAAIGSLSGQAIRHLYQPMLQKAKTFRVFIRKGLQKRIELINTVWELVGFPELSNYEIQISDNLPVDVQAIAQENALMKDYVPAKTLIQRIPGIDTQEALELLQEQMGVTPQTPANALGASPGNANPANDRQVAERLVNREQAIDKAQETFSKRIGALLKEKRKALAEGIADV